MDLSTFNVVDLIFAGIFIVSMIVGLMRGLIREVLSLLAWVAAIWLAYRFSPQIAEDYIKRFFDDPVVSYLLAFGLIFIVALFLIGLVNLLLGMLLKTTGLAFIDRMMGMVFGIVRAVVILSLLVFFARLTPIVQEKWWQEAKSVPVFSRFADWGRNNLPENVKSMLDKIGKKEEKETAAYYGKATETELSPITLELLRQPNMQQWLVDHADRMSMNQRRQLENDLNHLSYDDTHALSEEDRLSLRRILHSFTTAPAKNTELQLESLKSGEKQESGGITLESLSQ